MPKENTKNPNYLSAPINSFAGLPVSTEIAGLEADIAIIGLHYVSPYPQNLTVPENQTPLTTTPDAIRRQSSIFIDHLDHYDFNFDDVLLADRKIRIVGISLFEVRPERDMGGLTATTGVQLIINFIGTMAHSGQF